MSTARHSVKAYRTQRARFADPARVTVGRAGAAFPVAQGEPADRRPKVETPAPSARSVTDSHTVMDCPVMNPHTARSALLEEWEATGTTYPYVTSALAWEVKRYALVWDVDTPDVADRDAVRAFVDLARKRVPGSGF